MSAPKLEPGQSLADCPATKEFRERHEQVARAAEEHAAQRQHAKGKGTARERIDQLLDNGSFPGGRPVQWLRGRRQRQALWCGYRLWHH